MSLYLNKSLLNYFSPWRAEGLLQIEIFHTYFDKYFNFLLST